MRMAFSDALPYFENGSIDLLHIDGRHFLEDVRADFESWLPKLSNRAVVLFHDINVRQREFGVHRLWSNLSEKYPNFSFIHGNGLGVLGIGKALPVAISNLFNSSSDENLRASIRNSYARLGGAVTRNAPEDLVQQRDRLATALEEEKAATRKLSADLDCSETLSNDRDHALNLLEVELRATQAAVSEQKSERDLLAATLEEEKAAAARNNDSAALLGQELDTLRSNIQERETATIHVRDE